MQDMDTFLEELLFGDVANTMVDPVAWLEREMYIPETNAPITLHPEQQRVIRAMMTRDESGKFLYSTMVYSSIKKSAKTTIGGGLALWQAFRVPNGQVFIVGNDLKQADSRMMQAIRYAVEHNPRLRARARVVKNNVYLDNGTRIEAVAVDAAGEAGSNPTGIFWTEAWGAKQKKHEEMWSEMALSPTRQGESFKFVESYAGHEGESNILWRLYEGSGVLENSVLDPDISPELYVNGRQITYWNTRRYLKWQEENDDYYRQEEIEKTPEEFDRVHKNIWASASNPFIPIEWWDSCQIERLAPLRPFQTVIVGMDAATTNDTFAITVVSRTGRVIELREVHIFTPPKNSKLDFKIPEACIRDIANRFRVTAYVYDPYQLHDMSTRLRDEGLGYFEQFTQGAPRLRADKHLYDIIRDGRLIHDGSYPEFRKHLLNASRTITDIQKADGMRIIKRSPSNPIDAVVASAMACERAAFYNIGD